MVIINDALKTVHIPQPVYENIVDILVNFITHYSDTMIPFLKHSNQKRVKELLDIILLRDNVETDLTVSISITNNELADILRLCWDAKNLYHLMGGKRTFGLTFADFKIVLNDIASVLGRIAEF